VLDLHIGTRPQSGDGRNTLAMDIGLVVAHIRKCRMATTAQMADLFGCSQAKLLKLEKGHTALSALSLILIVRHATTEALLFLLGRALETEHSALKSEIDAHLGPSGTPFDGEEIGLLIRALQAVRGISSGELAKMLYISQRLIAQLEAGADANSIPVIVRIMRLARETATQTLSKSLLGQDRKRRRHESGQEAAALPKFIHHMGGRNHD
jgi:transcriptional regulator with XRE-family HTH domain